MKIFISLYRNRFYVINYLFLQKKQQLKMQVSWETGNSKKNLMGM
jgi:hypothetical protein